MIPVNVSRFVCLSAQYDNGIGLSKRYTDTMRFSDFRASLPALLMSHSLLLWAGAVSASNAGVEPLQAPTGANGFYSPQQIHHHPSVQRAPRWLAQRRGRITREEAAAIARKRHGGRVLGVKFAQSDDGRGFYRVKMIRDGRVRVVRIPASRPASRR